MGRSRLTSSDNEKSWPKALKKVAKNQILNSASDCPLMVSMEKPGAEKNLEKLVNTHPIAIIKDNYDEQLAELLLSRNAQLYRANHQVQQESIKEFLIEHYGKNLPWQKGSWVYYPWSGFLVHVLEEHLLVETRTIRNKDLITTEEQQSYAEFNAGCLGMSVGSSAAVALTLQGASNRIKIADSAVISGSNLNRIRTGIQSVGDDKSVTIARQLYEMNPYIKLHRFTESINAGSMDNFFDQPWPLNVVIDEIDNLEIKVRLRLEARKRGVPVLMATDLGDDVMLDVERFDLDSSLPIFHGLAGDIETVIDKAQMSQRQWLKYANMIIGNKNVPLRLQQSLLKIGQTLPTQPQLGGTAMMAGSVLAYAVRMLALGQPLKGGRTIISLDHHLLKGHKSFSSHRKHRHHTKILKKALDAI